MTNNRFIPVLLLLLAVGAISAIISLAIVRANRVPEIADTQQFDSWLHKQLGITKEQESAMAADERKFHDRQLELVGKVQDLNRDLAQAIMEEKGDTPRVQQIIEQIQQTQGELQDVTIGHVFDMKQYLTPEQYEKLLKLTADALVPDSAGKSQPSK